MKGRKNIVADVLSRYPADADTLLLNNDRHLIVAVQSVDLLIGVLSMEKFSELDNLHVSLKICQMKDVLLTPLIQYRQNQPTVLIQQQYKLLPRSKVYQGILIYSSHLTDPSRLFLPTSLASSMLRNVHKLYGHFGVSRTFKVLKKIFYCSQMYRKLRNIVQACDVCQRTKYPWRGLIWEMHPILATYPEELVPVDYYGPLPESTSKIVYIFVVIDSFSKFVKLYPLQKAHTNVSSKLIERLLHNEK